MLWASPPEVTIISISRHNYGQLPLDGLDLPVARATRGPITDLVIIDDPMPGTTVLHLPRWDTDWTVKTGRNGWPKVNPKTNKVVKYRPVWEALTANARYGHWSARAKATRTVIDTVASAATRAGMKPCQHLTVQLVWAPGDNRRADRGNLMPLQKACIDALARGRSDIPGLCLVPDDTDRWVEELLPRIDRPPVPPGLWLEVLAKIN